MTPSFEVAIPSICDEIGEEFRAGATEVRVQRFTDGFLVASDAHDSFTAVFGMTDEETAA